MIGNIQIGRNAAGPVVLNVDRLLRSHLLIQASTGGGKSWLLRLLAEQLSQIGVQVLIIDPEGEFASLRAHFPFLLAGSEGDVPASPVSAAVLARQLQELRASAVIDLFDMKADDRRLFVARFLESLVESPRALWHSLVVFIDEAHLFAPEDDKPTSKDAVEAMATRGRKRGFGLVLATQRLAMLDKDVASCLQNVAIGPTFMDIDLKRAATALGIGGSRGELQEFFNETKVAEPGDFTALGRAISKTRVTFTSGDVVSPHPDSDSEAHAAPPPPTPVAIKNLLVHLSGLQEKAKRETNTIDDLRIELDNAYGEIERLRAAPPPPDPGVDMLLKENQALVTENRQLALRVAKLSEKALRYDQLAAVFEKQRLPGLPVAEPKRAEFPTTEVIAPKVIVEPPMPRAPSLPDNAIAAATALRNTAGGVQRIINVLGSFHPLSLTERQVGALADLKITGGTYSTYRGKLIREKVVLSEKPYLRLTGKGQEMVTIKWRFLEPREVLAAWSVVFGGKCRELLMLYAAAGTAIPKAKALATVGLEPDGGTASTYFGKLVMNGLVERAIGGYRAAAWIRV